MTEQAAELTEATTAINTTDDTTIPTMATSTTDSVPEHSGNKEIDSVNVEEVVSHVNFADMGVLLQVNPIGQSVLMTDDKQADDGLWLCEFTCRYAISHMITMLI